MSSGSDSVASGQIGLSPQGRRGQLLREYGHYRGFEEMADDLPSKGWSIVERNKGYMWLSLGANPHIFHSSVQVQQYIEQQEHEEDSDYVPTGTSPPSPSQTVTGAVSNVARKFCWIWKVS